MFRAEELCQRADLHSFVVNKANANSNQTKSLELWTQQTILQNRNIDRCSRIVDYKLQFQKHVSKKPHHAELLTIHIYMIDEFLLNL